MKIVIDDFFIVENGIAEITNLLPLTTVQNVRLRDVVVPRLDEYGFNAVLNVFNGDRPVFYLRLKIRRNFQDEEINYLGMIVFLASVERLNDCLTDFIQIECDDLPVALYNAIHTFPP